MLKRNWLVNSENRLVAVWTDSSAVTPAPAKVERRDGNPSRRTRRSVRSSVATRFTGAIRSLVPA
ncbi:MAG TPA: hypothetical protein VMT20_14800 [Terriglobia bacterium]|nr:hypothetical protein [Terriglobia bacterium]